jgi:hypothetical protein
MQRMLFAVAVLATAAGFGPGDHGSRPDVSGSYTSNWGAIVLHVRDARITGDYEYQHGHIDGVLDGNMIRYAWSEADGSGHGVFVIASDGELVGTWGVGDDDTRGGGWRLVPASGAAIAR